MNVLEEAMLFAVQAHQGQVRKGRAIPYILHPMEVAAIIATMTDDLEIMAAGVLHDTVEDCAVPPAEIEQRFGKRVAELVQSETEDKMPHIDPSQSWQQRKEESLEVLRVCKDIGVKILWLGDKLANMRSIYRDYQSVGDRIWQKFHQKDPKKHEWYYRTIAAYLADLSDTAAYQEYVHIVNLLFKGDPT